MWNIGEALGVLDEKRRRKWLTEKEFKIALTSFSDEMVKLTRLKTLEIVPLLAPIITDAWSVLMSYHIYQADALQITTCKESRSDLLISGDEKLIDAGKKTGLQAYNITKDKEKLKHLI